MKEKSLRKAWITPKVFVLGADNTQAYQKSATKETKVVKTLYTKTPGGGFTPIPITTYVGFQS